MKKRQRSSFQLYFESVWYSLGNLLNKGQIEISGYVAYASFLAFFPFLLILMGLMAMFGQTDVGEESLKRLYELLPAEVVETVSPVVTTLIHTHQDHILTISLIGMIWIASSGIEALRAGLNTAYEVQEPRSFFVRRLQSVLLIFVLVLGVFLSTTLMIFVPVLSLFVLKTFPMLEKPLEHATFSLNIIRYGGTLVSMVTVMSILYRLLPCVKLSFLKDCLPGAFVASLLWIGLANVFSLYIRNFASYNVLYGSVGGIVLTLVFFHLTALIILYGAEINAALRRRRNHQSKS